MMWIEKIENSENINQLPLCSELIDLAEQDDVELYEEWEDKIITIKDGTKVKLVRSEIQCFNEKKFEGHFNFYYIEDDDLYICAECGQWQKSYDDIKEEIGYDDIFNKAFPYDWNIDGVKKYLLKEMQIAEEKSKKKQIEYNNFNTYFKDCSNCKNMINNECLFLNMEYDEVCDDWEER